MTAAAYQERHPTRSILVPRHVKAPLDRAIARHAKWPDAFGNSRGFSGESPLLKSTQPSPRDTAAHTRIARRGLLAAVEGNGNRVVRVGPATGTETTDIDLDAFLGAAWGTRVSYVVAAYNDMAKLPGGDLLIGLEAFIPPASPRPLGHVVLDIIHGLEGGAWFLVRRPGGRYDLRQVTARFPVIGQNLVAARTFAASPFPSEPAAVHVRGYDANDTPAHDTAGIARFFLDRGR